MRGEIMLIGGALITAASMAMPASATAPADAPAEAPAPARAPAYRITHRVNLPGDEGWDDLTFEPDGGRLFISHGSEVLVVDSRSLKVVGAIPDTPGVHGIALAPEFGRGYISAGRAGTIVVFDLKSLARLKEIKATGENPDAIIYDPSSHRVFSFNGRGRNATAIDAKTDTVAGTVPLDAKPEFAVSDGKGRVYVNLEDKSSLAAIDPQRLSVVSVWPLSGCEEPSGLALDAAGQRLFAGCDNKVMVAVDATSGRTIGSVPIGEGVDGARYDPGERLAFASCGEGVLTVVRVGAGGVPEVIQSLPTERGA
ncbi:MAG: YncE family protein, partial [Gammaproteobacteria bacterium]|nr:YncE family protein [Gammaproteobacteria bacterium]